MEPSVRIPLLQLLRKDRWGYVGRNYCKEGRGLGALWSMEDEPEKPLTAGVCVGCRLLTATSLSDVSPGVFSCPNGWPYPWVTYDQSQQVVSCLYRVTDSTSSA